MHCTECVGLRGCPPRSGAPCKVVSELRACEGDDSGDDGFA